MRRIESSEGVPVNYILPPNVTCDYFGPSIYMKSRFSSSIMGDTSGGTIVTGDLNFE